MRIRVRRVGGITGNIAMSAELDTASLSSEDATRLEQALGSLPWGAPAPEPAHPDAFRYEVELPDQPGRGTAVLGEAQMEHGMELLRTQLAREGVIEPGRRSG